jgi:hypothetical protein
MLKVPFRSSGHKGGLLDSNGATEWLHAAFGRGHANLSNTELCAAQALCGEDTVVRSQLVTAHALQTEMYGKLDSVLSGAQGNKSVIVLKRL